MDAKRPQAEQGGISKPFGESLVHAVLLLERSIMQRIIGETAPIDKCSSDVKEACYRLLSHCFLGVTREDFDKDFHEKEAVILLRQADSGKIVGFSTLMTIALPLANADSIAVFSGDTAVLPEYRSSFGMGIEIAKYFLKVRERCPNTLVFYVLISKGWRTYKVLPFFFRDFYPNPQGTTASLEKEVADAFGMAKYPANYLPDLSLIRFSQEGQRLRPGSIDVSPHQGDPFISFFLQANPDYLRGDELVCVASIEPGNFTSQLNRLMGSIGK